MRYTTIEFTCEGKTIEFLTGNFPKKSIPNKRQTFSLQKNINGEIKSLNYIIESVFITGGKVQCNCVLIGMS